MPDKIFKYVHEDEAAFRKAVCDTLLEINSRQSVILKLVEQLCINLASMDPEVLRGLVKEIFIEQYKINAARMAATANEEQTIKDLDIDELLS
jgi:hypothetical protein